MLDTKPRVVVIYNRDFEGADADPENKAREDIKDIAKIDEVFRNGIGYDPRKLIADVRGKVGR